MYTRYTKTRWWLHSIPADYGLGKELPVPLIQVSTNRNSVWLGRLSTLIWILWAWGLPGDGQGPKPVLLVLLGLDL